MKEVRIFVIRPVRPLCILGLFAPLSLMAHPAPIADSRVENLFAPLSNASTDIMGAIIALFVFVNEMIQIQNVGRKFSPMLLLSPIVFVVRFRRRFSVYHVRVPCAFRR